MCTEQDDFSIEKVVIIEAEKPRLENPFYSETMLLLRDWVTGKENKNEIQMERT